MSRKRLVLVRHAHRETFAGRELDNGLSDKGEKQAQRLATFIAAAYRKRDSMVLLSSPYKRCIETFRPLERAFGMDLIQSEELVEQEMDESSSQFAKRVRRFTKSWEKSDTELTFVCSHGDWLPQCIWQLIEFNLHLKKGGLAEIVSKDGELELRTLVQRFLFVGNKIA